MIVIHPRIHTLAPGKVTAANPWGTVGAIRVAGDRVVAAGTAEAVLSLKASDEQILRPRAGSIIPGMIDTHAHLNSSRAQADALTLPDSSSPRRWARAVAERASDALPGQWIVGRAWNQTVWSAADRRGLRLTPDGFPTHHILSEAAPENPVALTRHDGHALWVNAAAVKLAGLEPGQGDPAGGRIVVLADGTPSGVLIDEAMGLVETVMPEPTTADLATEIRRRGGEFLAAGITCVHSAQVSPEALPVYEDVLSGDGALPLRVRAMVYRPAAELAAWAERHTPRPGVALGDSGMWRVQTLKAFADGALGSRGALLFDDYEGYPGERGIAVASATELTELAAIAAVRGWQLATHAIGDRGIFEVVEAYRRAGVSGPARHLRWRIEHMQHPRPAEIVAAAELGIAVALQPLHCTRDMRFAEALLGIERCRTSYPWRSLQSAGLAMGFGSDYPIESLNPLAGVFAAVTRTDDTGNPVGGWQSHERLTMRDAFGYYTHRAADLMAGDGGLGTLAETADFVALTVDPATDAPATVGAGEALWTVVAGRTAASKEATGFFQ